MALFCVTEFSDDDAVNFIRIVDHQNVGEHVEFIIEVTVGDYKWLVQRRYNEFYDFDRIRFKKLKRSFLPPKKLIGSHDEAFLATRQAELQDYLRTVFKLDAILQKKKNLNSVPVLLATFLDFNLYEVHGIIHDLAASIIHVVGGIECACNNSELFMLSTLQLYALTERMRLPEPTNEPSLDPTMDIANVIEFLSCLKRLKVTGGKCVGKSNIPLNSLSFSLRYFKSVVWLWIANCDPSMICDLESCRDTVVHLTVHNTLHNLSELVPSYSSAEPGAQDRLTWKKTQSADFSFNNLHMIDPCVKCFRYIRVLDLTCNCLRDIDNLQHLPYLTELNLSNNRIEKIEHWNKKLGNVKKLRLTNNKIHSLKGLSKLYSLEYLDVRDNNLSHIKQVWSVGQLPCLQVLLLSGNCVENSIDYRTRILEAFGERAPEVRINNEAATQRELDTVTIRLAIRKAKEERRLQLLNATKQISQAVSLAEAEVLKVSQISLSENATPDVVAAATASNANSESPACS